MPIVAQIVCDNCQAVKRVTNHWYAIAVENNSFSLKPLALPADWETKNFPDSSLQYFCGRFCAVEALTRWMNKLSAQTALFPINRKEVPIARSSSEEDSDERSVVPDRDSRSTLQGSRNMSLLES
jgi:hypothetical protein